jgi:mercuric ion transport protein
MSQVKSSGKLIGAGVLAAIAASLCCITPVLALIAGSSGIASAFSWLAPARPYLLGITVLVLGFAWYQKLKPKTKEEIECDCEEERNPKFIQSKSFLGIVTIFAALILAFPTYSKIFFPKNEKQIIIVDKSNIQAAAFTISGMDCEACEQEVKHEVNKLNGIIKAEASYEKGNAQVQFDNSKTNIDEITKAINSTGYKVTKSEVKN